MKRIFFSVDVHGNTALWRKWLAAREIYKANVLMFCGDLTGKLMVPIVENRDGTYTVSYRGVKRTFKRGELGEAERLLEERGVYYIVAKPEEIEYLKNNYDEVLRLMNEQIIRRMRRWLELVTSRIDPKEVTLIVMPGNDDIFEVDEVIREFEDHGVIYPLGDVVEVEGIEMISLDYVNPTPWSTPREAEDKKLRKMIDKLVSKLSNPSRSVWNFHSPPYKTKIDLAPELDKDLRPVKVGGGVRYVHVGSMAVRNAIEEYKPMLGLHGHIHESGGIDRVGDTVVLNPGSEYESAVLRGFIVEVEDGKVKNFWRVEG